MGNTNTAAYSQLFGSYAAVLVSGCPPSVLAELLQAGRVIIQALAFPISSAVQNVQTNTQTNTAARLSFPDIVPLSESMKRPLSVLAELLQVRQVIIQALAFRINSSVQNAQVKHTANTAGYRQISENLPQYLMKILGTLWGHFGDSVPKKQRNNTGL